MQLNLEDYDSTPEHTNASAMATMLLNIFMNSLPVINTTFSDCTNLIYVEKKERRTTSFVDYFDSI